MTLAESPETLAEFQKAEKDNLLDSWHSEQNVVKRAGGMFAAIKIPSSKRAGSKKHPSKIFEDTVLILIIFSSIMLAVDNPLYDPKSKLVKVL